MRTNFTSHGLKISLKPFIHAVIGAIMPLLVKIHCLTSMEETHSVATFRAAPKSQLSAANSKETAPIFTPISAAGQYWPVWSVAASTVDRNDHSPVFSLNIFGNQWTTNI